MANFGLPERRLGAEVFRKLACGFEVATTFRAVTSITYIILLSLVTVKGTSNFNTVILNRER